MRPILPLLLVALACSTTSPSTTCPSGNAPTCFGSAADTCYCTPVSTCAYCAALFNARPADPDPRCAPYLRIVPCTADLECPAGEVCLTATGVCDHACTATTLFLDGGTDAASFGDSGLDASALSSFENACVSYYGDLATPGACESCAQSQFAGCARVDASSCDPSNLTGCAAQCKVTGTATTLDCACIAACLGPCAAGGAELYACVTGPCSDSCQ